MGEFPSSCRDRPESRLEDKRGYSRIKSGGQRSLVGYSPWGHREWDTTERLTLLLLHPYEDRFIMFTPALFIAAKNWKQFKRLSKSKWINELCIHTWTQQSKGMKYLYKQYE